MINKISCYLINIFFGLCTVNLNAEIVNIALQKQGSTQTVTAEWVQHAHDAQHTNYTDQVVPHPWRWKWSWNGPNASGGIASGHHTLPRNVQPITGGGYVYIADGSNGVRVINETSGSVARTISPGGNCNSTPAYDTADGSLYVGSTNGNLYKINPANGNTLGTYNAGSAINTAPCLLSDRVFISAGNNVIAVNKSNMSQIWSYNAGSPVVTPPAYSPSRNYVVVVSQDLYVHCINNSNGLRVWRVKPIARNYQANEIEANWGWPVIAEQHGYILVKYRISWNDLFTSPSPFPTTNSGIRSAMQSNTNLQNLFCLDIDDGSVPFICNVGCGGWGDGGFLPMGPQPVVKKHSNGTETVFTVIRGDNRSGVDARGDSHFGEMLLDNTTVSGYSGGEIRWMQYGNYGWGNVGYDFPPSDEQPFPTMSGDYLFMGHWALGLAINITDRSANRGSWSNPIATQALSHFVTSSDGSAGSFSSTHYCGTQFGQEPDWRAVPFGFYIYYNQGSVYDNYWSEYACWIVSNNQIYYRSCDSAIVCLESGNPQASIKPASKKELAKCKKEEKQLIAGLNPAAKDRPETGPKIISYLDTRNHIGEIKTVEGELKWVFNNGKAVYLGFNNPHTGYFCVRIMKKYWNNFPVPPEKIYKEGMKVRVRGKIEWYQNDPVMYVTDPSQISIVSDKYVITKK